MSALTEMVIVYALVAGALIYVMRGFIMKLIFKTSPASEEGCSTCDSGGCATCKAHTMPDLKGL